MTTEVGNAVRVGIIGTGRHGSRYARHVKEDVNGLLLSAISRRSSVGKNQADQLHCRWHRNWQDLVSDPQVEAVIAVIPPALHPAVAECCVKAGKPLLLEKPLAVTASAAVQIVELFARHDLPLTIGQTLRYNSVIRGLRDLLPSIGTLAAFSANQRLEQSSLAWHDDPDLAGAGVSFHTAVHVFDALHFITGREVTRVVALSRRQLQANLEDSLAVLVEMEGGLIGTIDCSKIGPARSGRLEFVGTAGQLNGEQIHNVIERIEGDAITNVALGKPINTIVPLLTDWHRFISGQGENPVPGQAGLRAVRCCEACLRSAESGGWVELGF